MDGLEVGADRTLSFLGGDIGEIITYVFNQGCILKDCPNLNDNQKNMENEYKEKIDLNEEQKSLPK